MKAAFFVLCITCMPFHIDALIYESFTDEHLTQIHVLVVDPKEHAIVPAKAFGDPVDKETVSALAKRHGALAAVNGGFGQLTGAPSGVLKIDGHWYGLPVKLRGAIGWSSEGNEVAIDQLLAGKVSEAGDLTVMPGSSPPYTTPELWAGFEHIVGGAPVLVRDGQVIEDFNPEQAIPTFLTDKYPRTAVGIKKTGEWVFVVVDGSLRDLVGGMTMNELAELMQGLGCVEALNLSGGRSSTMVIGGIVINHPSGSIEENGKNVNKVSDAILIFPSEFE